MLTYKELSVQETEEIYRIYLVKDFPKPEVKPFWAIEKLMGEGLYRSLGFYEQEKLVGYTFFCDHPRGDYSLWDYFAVREDLRGQGYGQKIIEMLRKIHRDFEAVLLESEDPKYAADDEQLAVRERRLHFYKKCGIVFPGLTSHVFDVDYVVLSLECKSHPDVEEVRRRYREIYQILVSELHFTQKVHID